MAQTMEFPGIGISQDADQANYQNYLAWQQQVAQRRRHSATQFNIYQHKRLERMSEQALYKSEAEERSEQLKYQIERRLSQACDCESCDTPSHRSGSNASTTTSSSSSPTGSPRSHRSSLSSLQTSDTPPGTVVRGPTSPSSKNSLIVSPPPVSRHHRRRVQSLPNRA